MCNNSNRLKVSRVFILNYYYALLRLQSQYRFYILLSIVVEVISTILLFFIRVDMEVILIYSLITILSLGLITVFYLKTLNYDKLINLTANIIDILNKNYLRNNDSVIERYLRNLSIVLNKDLETIKLSFRTRDYRNLIL